MKRSETLSQRYSDEDDLLERSTKNSKENRGMEVDMDSDSMGGSQAVSEAGQAISQVEMVPETPLDDQVATPLTASATSPAAANPGSPDGEATSPVRESTPTTTVGDASTKATRSYAATEACPSGPKDDPITEDTGGGEEGDRTEIELPAAEDARRNSRAKSVHYANRPYGPWMIATRKERRQQGRQGDQGRPAAPMAQTTNAGHAKTAQIRSGSRFAPLENDELPKENDDQNGSGMALGDANLETENTHNDTQPGPSTSAPQRTARRANVIANEKQIANEVPRTNAQASAEKELGKGKRQTSVVPRRAAEEDEHVVNRGAQGGSVICSTTVLSEETSDADHTSGAVPHTEHHGDPPEKVDEEGDVIMDIDLQQRQVPAIEEAAVPTA
nr:uncharacterized protein LOC109156749 [Ipomoea batatas]